MRSLIFCPDQQSCATRCDSGIPGPCFNGVGVHENDILTASHKHPFAMCGADGFPSDSSISLGDQRKVAEQREVLRAAGSPKPARILFPQTLRSQWKSRLKVGYPRKPAPLGLWTRADPLSAGHAIPGYAAHLFPRAEEAETRRIGMRARVNTRCAIKTHIP